MDHKDANYKNIKEDDNLNPPQYTHAPKRNNFIQRIC